MDIEPKFVELAEGRKLAYSEYGAPAGPAVIYAHGYPSSRREAKLLHPLAERMGVRIISPDRPGYGSSDQMPDRSIAGWADDVSTLADALELDRFAMLGVSGGGPYALACASRIPGRLTACSLICPLGPIYLEPVLGAMNWPSRVNFSMARHTSLIAQSLFGRATASMVAFWPESIEHLWSFSAPPQDREELDNPETRLILSQTIQDAMRNGAIGALQDLSLYTHDWGIAFDSIGMEIEIWHGEEDGTVPVSHSGWYAKYIPHTRVHYLEGEGHFSLPMRHGEEILGNLIEAAGEAASQQ